MYINSWIAARGPPCRYGAIIRQPQTCQRYIRAFKQIKNEKGKKNKKKKKKLGPDREIRSSPDSLPVYIGWCIKYTCIYKTNPAPPVARMSSPLFKTRMYVYINTYI